MGKMQCNGSGSGGGDGGHGNDGGDEESLFVEILKERREIQQLEERMHMLIMERDRDALSEQIREYIIGHIVYI